jgi:hypothetical protein
MDSKTYASNVSEAKIAADLAHKGFHVFSQSSGKAPFDLIYADDYCPNVLRRVQVKACYKPNKSGTYTIQLRTIHTSMKKNTIVKFDSRKCDILAIYLIDIDKIIYLNPEPLHDTSTIAIHPNQKGIVMEPL